MMKRWMQLILLMTMVALLAACGKDSAQEAAAGATIAISGSTSVGPLAEKLAMKYEEQEAVNIEVNQIGSSAGITNATTGVSEIGMSSRDLKRRRKSRARGSSHCL